MMTDELLHERGGILIPNVRYDKAELEELFPEARATSKWAGCGREKGIGCRRSGENSVSRGPGFQMSSQREHLNHGPLHLGPCPLEP